MDSTPHDFLASAVELNLLAPVSELLASLEFRKAGYFHCLDPYRWEVRRILGAAHARSDPAAARELVAAVVAHAHDPELGWPPTDTAGAARAAVALRERLGFSPERAFGAAVNLVETRSPPLGSVGADEQLPHWTRPELARPLTRLQHALDWAALGGDGPTSLVALQDARPGMSAFRAPTARTLVVPFPPRGELAPLDAYDLLAKQVLYLGAEGWEEPGESPRLDTLYLPVRGLAQWRAALVLIRAQEQIPPILSEFTGLAFAAVEQLFSNSVIEAFALSLQAVIASGGVELKEGVALHNAFALLWWAEELDFANQGRTTARLTRDRGGVLRHQPLGGEAFQLPEGLVSAGTRFPGFFAFDGACHPRATTIVLRLDALLDERLCERVLRNEWHFDTVRVRCFLFDARPEQLHRHVDQLAERLYRVIVDHGNNIQSKRVETYESIGHWVKGAIKSTGWQHALGGLRTVDRLLARPQRGPEEHARIADCLVRAKHSLRLFSVAAGLGSLVRLVGIMEARQLDKLAHWFSPEAEAAWHDVGGSDDAFVYYRESIVQLARAICTARGWSELPLRVTTDGNTRDYRGMVDFRPDDLVFPPLTREGDGEPVSALLPALVEPILNGINHLKGLRNKGRVGEDEPLRIELVDRRQGSSRPSIGVRIGNRVQSSSLDDPPGLRITRRLMDYTRLAHIRAPKVEEEVLWIEVALHPLELRDWIAQVEGAR